MASKTFRRDRKPGVSQAAIAKAFRAARSVDRDAVVEFDPIGMTVKIRGGTTTPAGSVSEQPAAVSNLWDEVYGDAPDQKRSA
jgi:hypothetical protein